MGCRPGNCHRLGWLWRVPPKTIMPCDCASWRTISLGFGLSLRKDPILSQKMWTTIRMPLGIWCIHLYLQCLKLKPSSDLSGKPTGFNLLDPGWWKILSSAIGCHWCMMVPSLSSHHSIPFHHEKFPVQPWVHSSKHRWPQAQRHQPPLDHEIWSWSIRGRQQDDAVGVGWLNMVRNYMLKLTILKHIA